MYRFHNVNDKKRYSVHSAMYKIKQFHFSFTQSQVGCVGIHCDFLLAIFLSLMLPYPLLIIAIFTATILRVLLKLLYNSIFEMHLARLIRLNVFVFVSFECL